MLGNFKKFLDSKYVRNISWLFLEKGLRITFGLSVGLWVARYLGPDKFGELSYAQSIVGIFTAFAAFGLEGIVIRDLVRSPDKKGEILGTALFIKTITTIIAETMLLLFVTFFEKEAHTQKLVGIVSIGMLIQIFNIFDFYFKSEVKSRFIVYANTLSLVIISLIRIYLILNNYSVIYFG